MFFRFFSSWAYYVSQSKILRKPINNHIGIKILLYLIVTTNAKSTPQLDSIMGSQYSSEEFIFKLGQVKK